MAIRKWQELADQLKDKAQPHKPDDPEERQWHAKVVHGRGVLEAYRHPRTYGIPIASTIPGLPA